MKYIKITLLLLLSVNQGQAFDKAPYQQVVDQVKTMWAEAEVDSSLLANDFTLGAYDKNAALQIIPQIITQYPKLQEVAITSIETNEEKTTMLVNYYFNGPPKELSEIVLNKELKILKLEVFDDILSESEVSDGSDSNQSNQHLFDQPFLNSQQLNALFDQLIEELVANDTEAIQTRNETKSVLWKEYVALKKPAFVNSQSWDELADAYDSLGAGFVNLHSKFKFNAPPKKQSVQANIKIGYTYPEIGFFIDDDEQQDIVRINEQHIKVAFDDFENLNCPFSNTIGCLRSFVKSFSAGKLKVNNEMVHQLATNQSTIDVVYELTTKDGNNNRYYEAIDVSNYADWTLLKKGYKAALFKKHDTLLLSIQDFVYNRGSGDDFRCGQDSAEKTLCYDVRLIREVLDKHQSAQTDLIIDVQNNGGGNENTAFLAELVNAPFEDLKVAFKNTEHMQNDKLRSHLFYGSKKAEHWFTSLNKADFSAEFLPERADFCQGDEQCQITTIQANNQRKFKDVYVLTNDRCVSSCDDFVWRMSEFGGAKIVGLPHSTDATYSRLSIMFYLNPEGKIQRTFYGDGMKADFAGIEIFSATIPYSKTINQQGQIRSGKTAPYEFILPVTKANFNNHAEDSLQRLFKVLNNK